MSTNERPTPETDVEEYNCSPNAEYGGQDICFAKEPS